MNGTERKYSRGFSIFLLSGAFLISSELPLLASPPQSSPTQHSPTEPSQANPVEPTQNQTLPDAPQAQAQPQPQQTPAAQQPATAPSGAAGAKAAAVKGAPVAQPAGAAVAPPRQHGHRSLIIKIGLLAGAGVAVGTAVALSERSPARPPGAPSTH